MISCGWYLRRYWSEGSKYICGVCWLLLYRSIRQIIPHSTTLLSALSLLRGVARDDFWSIPDPGSQSPNLGSFPEPKKRKNSKLKTKNSHFTVVIVPSLKFEDLFQICSLFQFPSASGTRWYTFMEQYSVSAKLLCNVSKLINPVARLSRETLSRGEVTEYKRIQYSQS